VSQTWLWVITLVPLVIFVVVDFYSGLKSGVIAAVATGALTAILIWWLMGELDWEAVFIVLVMAGSGWISVKKNNPVVFKLQPVITGGAVVIYLAWHQFFDTPYLLKAWPKLQSMMPKEQVEMYATPEGQRFLVNFTLYFLVWTFIHILIVTWAALKKSNKVWIIVKGLGIPFILLGSILTMLVVQSFGF
jgi:intracellular septation protein A